MCRFRHPAQFGLSFVSKLYPNAPLPSIGRAEKVVSSENIIKICSNLAIFMRRFLKHLCFFLPFCSIVERFGSPWQTKTPPLPCPVCVPFCNRRKNRHKKGGRNPPASDCQKSPIQPTCADGWDTTREIERRECARPFRPSARFCAQFCPKGGYQGTAKLRRCPRQKQPKRSRGRGLLFASPLRRAQQKQGTATKRFSDLRSRQKRVPPGAWRFCDTLNSMAKLYAFYAFLRPFAMRTA